MNLRTIMLFPKFENMEVINQIRKQYDPLANLVNPHITLVFPFQSEMSNAELFDVLESRLAKIKPFEIELCGFTKQEDKYGNYLFLNIGKGKAEINDIHQTLYNNEFKEFDLGLDYVPHMTVGNLPEIQALNEAYESVKDIDSKFRTIIDKIYMEMIGDNDESIIVIEKKLG